MPVEYRIDPRRGMIHTRCIGDVTIEEVIGHFRELEKDPECPPYLDVLLDLTEETSLPEVRNLRDVVREMERVRYKVQFGTCAIVAPRDALFGMIRMFEVFAEPVFTKTRVFRTVREAESWLASELTTGSHPRGGGA
jgi:hypothetical protein